MGKTKYNIARCIIGLGEAVVGFIVYYKDIANTALKTKVVTLYELHIYLLNIKKKRTAEMMNTKLTTVAFLDETS